LLFECPFRALGNALDRQHIALGAIDHGPCVIIVLRQCAMRNISADVRPMKRGAASIRMRRRMGGAIARRRVGAVAVAAPPAMRPDTARYEVTTIREKETEAV